MSAGDYLHQQFQYKRKTTDKFFLAATDDQTDVITVKSANHRLYIQKIIVSITTHADQTMTFQDDADTPVPIAVLTDEATVVPTVPSSWVWDFGPTGIALTLGKNFDIMVSAAGIAAAIHIEAYEKLEGAIAAGSSNY